MQREILEGVRMLAKKVIDQPNARDRLGDQKSFELVSHLSTTGCIRDMEEYMEDLSKHWGEKYNKRIGQAQIVEVLGMLLEKKG